MFKFVVIWALCQSIPVSAPADPYTGVVPTKTLREGTIRIMYKSFKTDKEAKEFMDHAPAYIREHMHEEDMTKAKEIVVN